MLHQCAIGSIRNRCMGCRREQNTRVPIPYRVPPSFVTHQHFLSSNDYSRRFNFKLIPFEDRPDYLHLHGVVSSKGERVQASAEICGLSSPESHSCTVFVVQTLISLSVAACFFQNFVRLASATYLTLGHVVHLATAKGNLANWHKSIWLSALPL